MVRLKGESVSVPAFFASSISSRFFPFMVPNSRRQHKTLPQVFMRAAALAKALSPMGSKDRSPITSTARAFATG